MTGSQPALFEDINAPSLDMLRTKQKRMEENPRSEIPWHPINPEYAKKLFAKEELIEIAEETVRSNFVERIRVYERFQSSLINARFAWRISEDDKIKYRTIVSTIYAQIQYLHMTDEEKETSACPKSLLLVGETGKGKSTILDWFMRPVFMELWRGHLFLSIKAMSMQGQLDAMARDPLLFIDDLGLEISNGKDAKGNMISKSDIAAATFKLLDHRRRKKLITNITTNLSNESMIEVYGQRAQWRFEQQFEFIEL